MNNKRYDGIDHPVREVTDLKDIIYSSCELFPDVDAYLYKDKKQGNGYRLIDAYHSILRICATYIMRLKNTTTSLIED